MDPRLGHASDPEMTPDAPVPVLPERTSERTREFFPGTQVDDGPDLVITGLEMLTAELAIPQRLGKYQIKGQIGRGGMGVVLKAFDPDLQRTVAIKVLATHLAQSEVARRRFQREARAAAAINHENVLTIHSVEEQNETPFLVMEFVSGQSLKEYIIERRKLTAMEVIRLSAQIAQGLAAAHLQGVIHRDVKPANVMLHEGATRVRLMDFGLARVACDNSDLTSHDHTVGTPAYMAPEQVMGKEIDSRADLFSLGCVIYSMATGHSPFYGKNHIETIRKIVDLTPAALQTIDPAIPSFLSDMVDKLLQKNPDDRYQSAFEVAETLGRFMALINQTPTTELESVMNASPSILPAPVPAPVADKSGPISPNLGPSVAMAATILVAGSLIAWMLWNRTPLDNPGSGKQLSGNPVVSLPSQPVDATAATSPDPGPGQKLKTITVGTGPEATCATVSEALHRAAENCTITVMGSGPLEESISITGSSLNGLQLKASGRVLWRCPANNASAIIELGNVSRVSLEGFDFETEPRQAMSLAFSGVLGEITVRDCSFRQVSPEHDRSVVEVAAQGLDSDSWIRFRDCRFLASQGPVMCLAISAPETNPVNIECRGCQFAAPNTQLFVSPTCSGIRLAGNVFKGGQNAIILNLKTWRPDSHVEIVNNTIIGTRFWIGLMESFRSGSAPSDSTDSMICNNLILGGERIQGGDDQWRRVMKSWRFASNWWEPDASTAAIPVWSQDWNQQVASFHPSLEIPERTNPTDPDYLTPSANSPLFTSGVGGDLPVFIGAKGPRN